MSIWPPRARFWSTRGAAPAPRARERPCRSHRPWGPRRPAPRSPKPATRGGCSPVPPRARARVLPGPPPPRAPAALPPETPPCRCSSRGRASRWGRSAARATTASARPSPCRAPAAKSSTGVSQSTRDSGKHDRAAPNTICTASSVRPMWRNLPSQATTSAPVTAPAPAKAIIRV